MNSTGPAWRRVVGNDPDEVAEQMDSDIRCTFTPAPVGREFSYDRSFLTLDAITFIASPGPASMAITSPADPEMFTAGTVTSGLVDAESASDHWRFGPGVSVVLPTVRELTTVNHTSVIAVVCLDAEAVTRVAAEVLGQDVTSIRFANPRPHSVEHARHWAGTVRYVNQVVVGSPVATDSPMVRFEAFRLLAVALLHAFRHESTAAPHGDRVEPSVIRRATEVIEAHAQDPGLDTSAIAEASGVGARALQLGFRRHRGTTPMAYLRRVRLAHAHADLQRGDPSRGDTVAEIAARWGFASPGHFASNYRRAYGVRPSETLYR